MPSLITPDRVIDSIRVSPRAFISKKNSVYQLDPVKPLSYKRGKYLKAPASVGGYHQLTRVFEVLVDASVHSYLFVYEDVTKLGTNPERFFNPIFLGFVLEDGVVTSQSAGLGLCYGSLFADSHTWVQKDLSSGFIDETTMLETALACPLFLQPDGYDRTTTLPDYRFVHYWLTTLEVGLDNYSWDRMI